jgi:membrane associated rhomboid family serine protease
VLSLPYELSLGEAWDGAMLIPRAQIPGNTFAARFAPWNVLTGAFFESSFLHLAVDWWLLAVAGSVLEPAWGSLAFLRFMCTVVALTGR